jgi:Asp/Glu/hydantoin racemase
MAPRIALIHAVSVAMQPIADAFRELWPEAQCFNLLDDSLSVDRARAGELTPEIAARIAALANYARGRGADAILYTCSAFGPAIEAVARASDIPVLTPNEAMFADAMWQAKHVGMLATFEPSVASMEAEFAAQAEGTDARITSLCVSGAMAALQVGDPETHDRLIMEAAQDARLADCEVLMLAQFSMARARDIVAAVAQRAVLTSPHSAVMRLKRRLS